jgi:RNA-directed DNA polymerase
MESLRRFITTRLRLRINENKSAVARPHRRKFLGFSFTSQAKPRRRIAPKSVLRFKKRIREITGRTRGRKLNDVVRELNLYLNGWRGYFGYCETRSVLRELDGWIRRRLRAYLWKQWKTFKKRRTELLRRGVNRHDASRLAASSKGPWPISQTTTLLMALRNDFFDSLGLVCLWQPA